METKRISDYVIRKLKEYAAIPSLTHHEDEFLNYLIADFGTPQGMEWIKVKIEGKQQAQFLHNVGDDSGLVFTVHTDRVPDADGNPFQNIIAECKDDGSITGQLDDLIAIAILRHVIESGIKVNILFTTQEEICNSYVQVAAVADNFGLMPVSIDIDPVRIFDESKDRAITIREKSFSYLYEPETVRMLSLTISFVCLGRKPTAPPSFSRNLPTRPPVGMSARPTTASGTAMAPLTAVAAMSRAQPLKPRAGTGGEICPLSQSG